MLKSCAFLVIVAALARITNTFTNTFTTFFEQHISLAMLSQSNVSMVTMPLAIRVMLCKMMQVSRGSAKDEILHAFDFMRKYNNCHVEVQGMTDLLRGFTIIFLNKIYVNDTKDLHPLFFEKSSTRKFGVHVEKKKFSRPKSALAYINRWFEIASLRRISNILEIDEVNANTSIIAVNAAHVQSSWEKPFNIIHTKTAKFTTPNNSIVPVQMMTQKNLYLYYYDRHLQFQGVLLTLDTTSGMTVTESTIERAHPELPVTLAVSCTDGTQQAVLLRTPVRGWSRARWPLAEPTTVLLGSFSRSYAVARGGPLGDSAPIFGKVAKTIISNPTLLQNTRHLMTYETLSVSIPRFRIKSDHIWDEVIQLMGVKQIFNSTYSGLDGLLKSNHEVRNMYLSLVKQKVVLEVDEMGAFRVGIPEEKSEEIDKRFPLMKSRKGDNEFVANRPFFFSIDLQMTTSGDQSMLLFGAYYGPQPDVD